jgi:transposase
LAQKLEIEARAAAGESDRAIASAMRLSIWVVRKWRRRVQSAGRAGLSVPRGRPKRGALSTYPAALREQLLRWRQAHPGWGPTTMLARLKQDSYWQSQPLPDRSQIGRFLREAGQTRRYQRHSPLATPPRKHPQAPHEEWELDAQAAQQVAGLGWVILLNIIDVYSTMKIASQATLVSGHHSKAKAEDHQLALRRGFLRAGLPDRLAVDHDSVYYDRSPSPFPTRLHLWLVALERVLKVKLHPYR